MNPPQSESIPETCGYVKRHRYLSETDPAIAKACVLLSVLRCELFKLKADYRVRCWLRSKKGDLA